MSQEVLLGFSGGVDSFYSAYLLKKQGFKVHPVLFLLSGKENVEKAKRSAELLNLSLTVVDYRELFLEEVIEPFIDYYKKGLTPNPCVMCNKKIKIKKLYELSENFGMPFIATGHYARIVHSEEFGQKVIKRGIDFGKEQSYFLSTIEKSAVQKLILPLGNLTKKQVIKKAKDVGFDFKGESQDICFIDGSVVSFLSNFIENGSGKFVLTDGTVLGKFDAFYKYTVGQRRGLGIPYKYPLYVLNIDVKNRKVVLGKREELLRNSFYIKDVVWHVSPEKFRDKTVEIQIRYRGKTAVVKEFSLLKNDRIFVKLQPSLDAPTPGQVCAFYNGDTLLGGGELTTL
ncbi:tRNA 2-thiouridine(34) synthase MnmA [Desulfurobacterium indicum]|uniref:tRNA-uridine 2-sulfurtransferase n=1 Tax=Desulfurobacterium indicum TaxID=1914305 RepID=A0A1R1MNG6_9BACT|nr:tRNA 2-thiouridine(34) synthase MnmA [Desulfurobacterium indicum]OMH41358.1 tRNA 2-thiouridine(34) synthase MnmA [Desulfurobacterium indicum]